MKAWKAVLIAVAARVAVKLLIDRWLPSAAFSIDLAIGSVIAACGALLWSEWRRERQYFREWEDDIRNGLQMLIDLTWLEQRDSPQREVLQAAIARMHRTNGQSSGVRSSSVESSSRLRK